MGIFDKKYNIKDKKKKISWCLIVVLLFTMTMVSPINVYADSKIFGKNMIDNIMNYFSEPNSDKVQAKAIEDDLEEYEPDIRILEVEPADSFKVSNIKGEQIKTGIEIAEIDCSDGKRRSIAIDHISMPEFIGKTNKINGKYDIVFIGRYVDTNNINSTKNRDQLAYIDYGDGTIQVDNNSASINNDITNRKADEILNFINSGQLVYIDKSIMSNEQGYGRRNLSNKNIYNKFKNISKANLIEQSGDSSGEELLKSIIEKYLSDDVKDTTRRLNLTVEGPVGDSIDDTQGKIENRNLNFKINISNKVESNIKEIGIVNLYLDINGDGLYKEEELFESKKINISDTVNINYQMPEDFVGDLTWKIEVVRNKTEENSELVKTYVTGSLLLRQIVGKREIRVLEISPYWHDGQIYDKIGQSETENHLGNLNLSENERFQKLIKELPDYNITVRVISIFELQKGKYKDGKEIVLNGNYDMIIFGFADNYRAHVSTDLNDTATKLINDYIATGQGVMLTHDTLSTGSNMTGFKKVFNNDTNNLAGLSKELTIANAGKLEWPNTQTKIVDRTNKGIITTYPYLLDEEIGIRRTHGQWYQLDLENENVIPWYIGTPNTVWTANTSGNSTRGSIKDYSEGIENDSLAEELKKELERNYNNLANAKKRIEGDDYWYTDNIPQKEGVSHVVNTNTECINKYDVRNNYYTYSSGNITFSGTGENNKERDTPYPTSELKLFVNTIVKAERAANHAPVINCNIPDLGENAEIEIPYNEDYEFEVTPTDIDNDAVKINVQAYTQDDTGYIKYEHNETDFKPQGETRNLSINKSAFENSLGKTIIIKIEAEDEHGAKAIKYYKIKPTNETTLKVECENNNGLVGENIVTNLTLSKVKSENQNEIIKDIKISVMDYNKDIFTNVKLGDLSNNPIVDDNTKLNTTLEAITKVESKANYIPLEIRYNIVNENGNIKSKLMYFNVSIYSKQPIIKAVVQLDNQDELGFTPQLLLTGPEISSSASGNECEWPNSLNKILRSGDYNLKLNNLNEQSMVVESYQLQREVDGEIININSEDKIKIDYNNPKAYITIKLSIPVLDLKHGLYDGKDSNGNVIIAENSNGFEVTSNMNVNFGATFKLSGSGVVDLLIDSKLESYSNSLNNNQDVNLNNIKIFKANIIDNKIVYEEFQESAISISRNENIYSIKINGNISKDTEILITYTGKTNSSGSEEYRNVITIGNQKKDVKVYTIKDNLPDLF